MKTLIQNNLAKIVVAGIFVAVLSFVIGPAVKAVFIQVGSFGKLTIKYGFGYGYGYDGSGYGFGYGYGTNEDLSLSGYGFAGLTGEAVDISSSATKTSITFNYSTSYLAKTYVVYGTDSSLESGTTDTPIETSFA